MAAIQPGNAVPPARRLRRPPVARRFGRRWLVAGALAGSGLASACTAPRATSGTGSGSRAATAPPDAASLGPAATPAVVTYRAEGPARQLDQLALPLRLLIPRVGADGPVIAVGLTADGAMDIPQEPNQVAWYQYSALPGRKGNAVLAGHLNWKGVDGVFRRLAEVKPGDAVVVRAADGEERGYGVEWNRDVPLASAPIAEIFEPTDRPALTLITCGGRWNPATQKYDRRVVVRAYR